MSIRTLGAARSFAGRSVFSGLDLDVATGSRLLLAGGNGSGKTTLLRCLAGTLTLTAGRAEICGLPAGSLGARQRVGLCLAPEQGLYDRLSARANLELVASLRLSRTAATSAVTEVEREFEIDAYATLPAQHCSAGMRARVSIARALLGGPAVLLLDEPGRSLDERGRTLLWAALDRRRLTCVIASHQPDDRSRCDEALDLPVRR
ncbi:ATP-binding cassette domain-containing protein [Plantactinospora sp. GCM10030261]|uniref:ABC transporter ATP-binding protein n=1 Tax=Plantactinospora sp. GCM10030261 TaxID=3273420 RepID=UPI00361C6D51